MKNMFSRFFLLPLLALTSIVYAESITLESKHFSVVEPSEAPFISAELLAEMDLEVDTFLDNFQLSLDGKFSIEIFIDERGINEKISVSEEFWELSRYSKQIGLASEIPYSAEALQKDVENTKWFSLQSAFEFIFDGKIGDKGFNGNFLVFAYLRQYFFDYSIYEGLEGRLNEKLAQLVSYKNNFSLSQFSRIPEEESPPLQPQEREIYFNDVLYPLCISFLDFVITEYGYETLVPMLTSDDISTIVGITPEEFEDLWFAFAQSKFPPIE